ncbi:MAG: quinol monooxygenase YgiN [Glaciecola sp.]|jgi:quinol monooxygenase YgiN
MEKVIIAQLSIQQSKIDAFLSLAKIMVNTSASENGCITYKLLKEIDKENSFFFYEKYESKEAVEVHNSSEHFNSFITAVTLY